MDRISKSLNIRVLLLITLFIVSAIYSFTSESSTLTNGQKLQIDSSLEKLPLYFVKNDGKLEDNVEFYVKGTKNWIFLKKDGVHLVLQNKPAEIVRIAPLNANKEFEIMGEERNEGKVNYFIGNCPENWKRNLPTFNKIRYKEVWNGVDIAFYGRSGNLKYDIVVKPGADISKISFEIEKVKEIELSENGGLIAKLPSGKIIYQRKPYIYQEIDGKIIEIEGFYRIKRGNGKKCFDFVLKSFNSSYPLIIDPTLIYSTYLGGSSYDGGYGISVDLAGNVYIIGQTFSSDFPVSSPIKGSKSGYYDIFVTKINPEGNSIVYSTFIGGNGDDYGYAIGVDSSGNAYITGYTESLDFPTQNPAQKNNSGGRDVFVAKINSEGDSLIYSTYLGGSGNDYGYGIALDGKGNAYLTGFTYSTDFPLKDPFYGYSGYGDIFLTKIASDGNILYSTYFGGSNNDCAYGIAVDSSGNVYLTGTTYSTDFPIKNPIKERGGLWDSFLVKINSEGNQIILSSFIGGSDNDYGTGIAVDSLENVYITGYTSSPDFPIQNPIQKSIAGNYDAFVSKISTSEKSVLFSTFIGGKNNDHSREIATDLNGNVYIAGETYSTDFPTYDPIQESNAGYWDAFVVKINLEANVFVYSTYLGGSNNDYAHGIAVDILGNAYVTGYTSSSNFPTAIPIYGYSSGYDSFVAKIEAGLIKYTLTVKKTGTGTGIVTSDDGRIQCGEQCLGEYNAGTFVTLTAMPDEDSSFTGWDGDCQGTEQKIEVKMDSKKNCIANFEKGSLPDLVGEWINGKISRLISGIKVFNAIFRTKNIGTAECSSEFNISFYLSNNGTTLDTLLKTFTISQKIGLNEYKDSLFSFYFPSYLSLSGKYIIAVIDSNNTVKERNKTNNQVSYGPLE